MTLAQHSPINYVQEFKPVSFLLGNIHGVTSAWAAPKWLQQTSLCCHEAASVSEKDTLVTMNSGLPRSIPNVNQNTGINPNVNIMKT